MHALLKVTKEYRNQRLQYLKRRKSFKWHIWSSSGKLDQLQNAEISSHKTCKNFITSKSTRLHKGHWGQHITLAVSSSLISATHLQNHWIWGESLVYAPQYLRDEVIKCNDNKKQENERQKALTLCWRVNLRDLHLEAHTCSHKLIDESAAGHREVHNAVVAAGRVHEQLKLSWWKHGY